MEPRSTVCANWITEAELGECTNLSGVPQAVIDFSIATASEVLYHLSRRLFPGTCTDIVLPNARQQGPRVFTSQQTTTPRLPWNTTWGFCTCNRGREFGCHLIPEIQLGGAPITDVLEVKIDGVVLVDQVDYAVDDYRWLVRLDNEGWPCCQDRNADPDDPTNDINTFRVTYEYGKTPTEGAKLAARLIAAELAKSCTGGDCQLPKRVTTITRQGTTAVVLDPFDFLDNGSTGIYEVDLWLKAVNPSNRRRRATFSSPDIPRRVRRTNTAGPTS